MDTDNSSVEFQQLVDIIRRLRAPNGCPWDREQTHRSMRDSLLEESYEVLETIDENDPVSLREELGDLLMQVVCHAQIASENSEFDLQEVVAGINEKLIRRHPHVFGEATAKDSQAVLARWEELKKKERQPEKSMLDGVPKAMPALAYSQEIQGRVARVGFDWKDDSGVMDKLVEEVKEAQSAITKEQKEEEFGDILFTLTNIVRRQGMDAESALRAANSKFYRRFKRMENYCSAQGICFKDLTFDQQNELWERAKSEDL